MDRRQVLWSMAGAWSLRVSEAVAAADRRQDLEILQRALALHPGLYRYNTPARIDASLARLRRDYLAATDLAGCYLALSLFLATLRCGHSYANFYNQSRAVVAELFDRPTRLPFEFRWIEGRMVVTRWLGPAPEVARGSVVETLDGQPAKRLLARLMPYARADGGNDDKRRSLLSVQGQDSFEYFDVFQGLLQPPRAGLWRLRLRTPDGARRDLEVPALTLAQRLASRPAPEPGAPEWTWSVTPESVAVLTMPTWATYSFRWKDWQSWLQDRLASLSGTRGLVIDLRANEGGEDVGDEILARLAGQDLRFDEDEQRLRFQRTPPDLDPYLDTWDDGFRTLGEGAAPLGDGFFARPGAEAVTLIRARTPRITVPVAALIGPVNSSATFHFALRARHTGLVRTFGQQTGGNLRGINGGCFFFVRLPGTGLEFDLPLVGYFPRQPQPDAGLMPDVPLRDSLREVLSGADPTLSAALEWVRRAG